MRYWAACQCFYEENIFLKQLGHVVFRSPAQFQQDHAHLVLAADDSTSLDLSDLQQQAEAETVRRRQIVTKTAENAAIAREKYKPLEGRLFHQGKIFPYLNQVELSQVKSVGPGVFSFPFLRKDDCTAIRRELEHFKESGLPRQKPNSMNNNGVLMAEVGLDGVVRELVQSVSNLATSKFPSLVGPSGLDSFKAFTVEYEPGDGDRITDTELAVHFDNAEVTLNIPLSEGECTGAELCFQSGREKYFNAKMKLGEALIHSGRQLHCVLPIAEGQRTNLIVWMRSSDVRNQHCPMCSQTPRLEKVSSGSGDGFTVAA